VRGCNRNSNQRTVYGSLHDTESLNGSESLLEDNNGKKFRPEIVEVVPSPSTLHHCSHTWVG
jgi:hypothetical protein